MKKTALNILIISIVFLVGFLLGKSKIETNVEYVKGDTITDTVNIPDPYKVEVTKYVTLPEKIDTLYKDSLILRIDTVTDTAFIVNDYSLRKSYELTVFDSVTIGTCKVNLQVQYNALQAFNHSFTPVTLISTQESKFTPFLQFSYSPIYTGVGGGIYYKNVGLGVKYVNNFSDIQTWESSLFIKF